MAQALYRKWRPRLWEQVVGQEHVVRTLQNAIRSGHIGHAYLFAGPRGTGKTTTARLLAKAVNCQNPDPAARPCDQCEFCLAVNESRFMDLIEIDAASNTSVDDVRDLRDKINFAPSQGKYKVYIIDEVHMLSTAAFNALLKTLEEPPAHAIFILATTEVHKIPATVLSRCQRHEFRRIPVQAIVNHLKAMAGEEKMQVDEDVLTLIARQSTGALRDGISLLDQLASTGETITLEMAQNVLGTATNQVVIDLVSAILARKADAGLDCIHRALDSGTDSRQFARQVVDYLRNVMLVRLGNADQVDATAEMRSQMAKHAQAFELQNLLETIRLFNQAASDLRSGWQPGLLLELALAESVSEKLVLAAAAPISTPQPQWSEPQPAPARTAHQKSMPAPKPAVEEKQPEVLYQKNSKPAEPQPEVKAEPAPTKPLPKEEPVEEAVEEAQFAGEEPKGEVDVSSIHKNWEKIKSLVRQRRGQTEALLNSCKLITMRGGVLYLGFASEIVKEKMENSDNIRLTQKAIAQVTGINLPVSCVVVNPNSKSLPPDLGVEPDGMVGTALDLGAEIVQKD